MRSPVVPASKALLCPNCGGTVELRGAGQALNAVCAQCLSILDASTPSLRILQEFGARQTFTPRIPLGKRGKLEGTVYEAIGFQVREIVVDGERFRWGEYLLYNPYKGYRYLTEYEGHWNLIRTLHELPEWGRTSGKPVVRVLGSSFRHFQSAKATTVFVMGEFPWQIRYGEIVNTDDYVAPPQVVSAETTGSEVTWSIGTYTPGSDLWKAFDLPGSAPVPKGVYSNQPSPYVGGQVKSIWKLYAALTLLGLAVWVVLYGLSAREQVFRQQYTYSNAGRAEASFVTPVFEWKGRPANVEVDIRTDLSNDWAFFNIALINEDTGTAYNAAKEVSYYAGRDGDGDWSEGGRSAKLRFPVVPQGHYYLRVEPEMDDAGPVQTMRYDLSVRRGVPNLVWFIPALLLLLVPPIFTTLRSFTFENRRWAESDYGPMVNIESGNDD